MKGSGRARDPALGRAGVRLDRTEPMRGGVLWEVVRPLLEAQGPEGRGTLAGAKAVAAAVRATKRAWNPHASGRDERLEAACARAAKEDRALRALDQAARVVAPGLVNPGPWIGGQLRTSGIPVGLNHVLFDAGLSKFGTTEEQLDDLQDLGAGFARHVASVDVTWRALTGDIMTPIPATYPELVAMVFGPGGSNRDALRDFFASARMRGVKVVLTTPMHAGGPSNRWHDGSDQVADLWTSGLRADFSSFVSDPERHPFWLDPYDADKLLRLRWICQAVGDLLSAAGAGPDVVLGIDGFNEVNIRNVYDGDAWLSGWAWGLVHYWCARALRSTAPDLPIWLPSLASYTLSSPTAGRIDTWEETVEFLDAMALEVVASCHFDGGEPASLAAGVDYHWYLAAQTDTDPTLVNRHIGYMLDEIDILRGVLRSYTGLEAAEVAVLETGASANMSRSVGEELQAHEVWRRVGGALASGVARAAWHTWMSTEESRAAANFAEFGLRYDLFADDEPASNARPRRSWGAFWQLTQVLKVQRGRLLTPNPAEVDSEPDRYGLVIFEYRLVGGDYAYLILVDPSELERSYRVTSSWARFTEYETAPAVSSTTTGGLPAASVSGGRSYVMGTLAFDMAYGDAPRLVRTASRVTWSVRPA